jgi:hypothetical protein
MNAHARNGRVAKVAWVLPLLVALAVGAVGAGTAGAASQGLVAQTKLPLTDTGRNCDGVADIPPTAVLGSATMNQTKAPSSGSTSSNLSAALTITHAAPNATYNIRIIEVDNSGNAVSDTCTSVVGTVAISALGTGSATVARRVLPGATRWWVVLNNQNSFIDFLDTDLVSIV